MMMTQVKQLGMLRSPAMHKGTASTFKAAIRPREAFHNRRSLRVRASDLSDQAVKQTVAGGGYSGVCDIDHVKETLKECAGLEGAALEACWADSGCDVNAVTEHYLKVAGLNKNEFNCFVTHDGHLVSDGLPSGKYTVSAWWAGVEPNEDEGKKAGNPLSSPACSASQQTDCTLIVTKTGDRDLVCPGLADGEYTVTNIQDFGGLDSCGMDSDGNIACEVEWPDTPSS